MLKDLIKVPIVSKVKLEHENKRLTEEINKYIEIIRNERKNQLNINTQCLNKLLELDMKIEILLKDLLKSKEAIESETKANIRQMFKSALNKWIVSCLDIENPKDIYNIIKDTFDPGGLYLYMAANKMGNAYDGDLWTKAIKEAIENFNIKLEEIPKIISDFVELKELEDLKLKDFLAKENF